MLRFTTLFKRAALSMALLAGLACSTAASASNSSVYCDRKASLTAEQKNQLLNFSDAVRQTLQQSGSDAAIISRSGIDLDRFHIRYSHSGFAVKGDGDPVMWSVRQLYYGCEDAKPSIYDQGLAGFLVDHDNTSIPFVSLVFLPQASTTGAELRQAATDKPLALNLLGGEYSANSYAFSTEFQNCNQWLMEVLAFAWGHIAVQDEYRKAAQEWLKNNDYHPSDIDVGNHLLVWLSAFVPLVHSSDHPSENMSKNLYQVSMPASIESFVRKREPAASRVELCLNQGKIVIHQGWDSIADDCSPAPGDRVMSAL